MYAKAQMFLPRTAQDALDSDFVAADIAAGEAAIVMLASSKLKALKTTTVASDLSDITDNQHTKFQIMWRKYNTSDVIVTTPELTFAELVNAEKVTGAAGTAQATTVAITAASPPVAGDSYHLTIIDTTPGTANLNKYPFEYVATASYAASDVVDGLVSDINALSDTTKVTATDGGTTITLTGTTTENHFRVAVDCDGSAVITYATDLVPGTLLKAQVQQMEKNMKSHGEGITNTIWFPRDWTSEVSDVATNFNNMGVFQFKLNKPAKHGMNGINTENYTLYIAEAADINLVDALLAAWNTVK